MVLLFLSGIGTGELIVILAVALILLGPKRFPEAARKVGRVVRDFRRVSNDLQQQFDAEIKNVDLEVEVKEPSIPASYQATAPGPGATTDEAPRALPPKGDADDAQDLGYTAEMGEEGPVEIEDSRGSPAVDDDPGPPEDPPTVSAATEAPRAEADAEPPPRDPTQDDA
jgi:sec-independent protein translocase protein TatB